MSESEIIEAAIQDGWELQVGPWGVRLAKTTYDPVDELDRLREDLREAQQHLMTQDLSMEVLRQDLEQQRKLSEFFQRQRDELREWMRMQDCDPPPGYR